MILVAAAITCSIAFGAWAAARWGMAARRVGHRALDLMLWVVLPPCVFVNVAHFAFNAGDVAGLVEGYAAITIVATAAWLLARYRFTLARETTGSMICCSMVGNTGYFGIPVTLALLGREHLGAATAWDAMISGPGSFVGAFLIGSAFGLPAAGVGPGGRLRAFLTRNPVLWAIVAGIAVPRGLMPHVVVAPAQLIIAGLLPVGFAVIGIYLHDDATQRWWRAPSRTMLTTISLRMLLAPGLFAVMALSTHGVPTAFYLQAAAPTGVNALLAAHVFNLDSHFTAGVVAWSTLFGLLVILLLGLAGVG